MKTEEAYNQWHTMKAKHPDAMILLRTEGSKSYQCFYDDASDLCLIVGVELKATTDYKGEVVPYSEFEHFKLDIALPKLVRAGKRVAICEHFEGPRMKKLVKRGTPS